MAKKQNTKPVVKQTVPTAQPATKNNKTTVLKDLPSKNVAVKKSNISLFAQLCIGLSVITFIAYIVSLQNGYVLDDVMVLKENKYVIQGLKAIPEIFSTPHMRGYLVIPNDLYRPFSLAVFAVEYQFFGPNASVGHFFNIITYIGCVLALFVFANKFFGEKKLVLAFVVTLLFALHPLHTEVVSNIKSRDELLCFLFAFLAFNSYINYMKSGKVLWLILGILSLFISILSKETVITLMAIFPLYFFFYQRTDWKRGIFIMAGSLVVIAIFMVIRHNVLAAYNANQPNIPVEFIDNALSGASGITKFATEILIMGYYLRMMFIPYPLISNYSYNKIPFVNLSDPWVILTILLYAGMFYYVVTKFIKSKFLKEDKDPFLFSILFFLATISLFSNFPFLMGAEVAERFAFFATTGACIALGFAFDKWVLSGSDTDITVLKQPKALIILGVVCITAFILTFTRNFDWKSNYVLYKTDLAKSPEDSRLNYYLGTAMAEGYYESETDTVKRHQIDKESIEHLRKSLAIYPDYTEANAEIGRVFYREGKYDSAEKHDKKALSINPNHATANNNLGSVYLTLGRYPEAIALFKKTLSLDPSYYYAHFNMARAFMQLKNYDSAIISFRATIAVTPNNLDAQQELGMAYYYKQNWDSASVHFKKTLELNPNDANAVNNLGAIYLNIKRYNEAIDYFQKAIKVNPNYINAYSNLARAYFFSGNYPKTIETIFNNLKIAPKYYNDVPYIALSYQRMGKKDSALKYEAIAKKIYSNFKLE